MTDQAPTTPANNPAPAATPAAADNAAPATDTAAAAQSPTTPQQDMASSYNKDKGEEAPKDSGKEAPAQEQPKPDADDSKPEDQPSDEKDSKDTEDKDAKDKEDEEGNQEAQPPVYTDFALPEGMELDNEALDEVLPVFTELGANQEQAQKMVDVASSMLSKAAKRMADQHTETVNGWKTETQEIFGKDGDAKFQEKQGRAEEVIKHFFKGEQLNVLTHYGLGNHPGIFAMALAIAEGTGEDRGVMGSAANGSKGQETLGDIWYPKT